MLGLLSRAMEPCTPCRRSPVGASCWVLLSLIAAGWMTPVAGEEFTAEGKLARGKLLLPVSLMGVGPYAFLLDAGLRRPVLDDQVVAYLNLTPKEDQTVSVSDALGWQTTAPLVTVDQVTYTDAPAAPMTFVVSAMQPLAEWFGEPIAGLLPLHQAGMEVTLDLDVATVMWRPLEEALLDAVDDQTLVLEVGPEGLPHVTGILNGGTFVKLQIDPAFTGLLALPESLAKSVGDAPVAQELMTDASSRRLTRLKRLSLGEVTVAEPLCTVLEEGEAPRIGTALLRHFVVTLNYEHGLVRFAPIDGIGFVNPPLYGYGLALHRRDGGAWTLRVADPSPASKAGLRTGDSLVALNGYAVAGLAFDVLNGHLVAIEGDEVQVTISREGETRDFTLSAARLL